MVSNKHLTTEYSHRIDEASKFLDVRRIENPQLMGNARLAPVGHRLPYLTRESSQQGGRQKGNKTSVQGRLQEPRCRLEPEYTGRPARIGYSHRASRSLFGFLKVNSSFPVMAFYLRKLVNVLVADIGETKT